MIDWENIDHVFLDMDGTLLDLSFDNHFWLEFVPLRYAEQNNLPVEQAKSELYPRFNARVGTMEWYCVDFWSQELSLDIAAMKSEIAHRIQVRPTVHEFLRFVRTRQRKVVLLTNAHRKTLQIKMEQTGLSDFFDELICSHDFGLPKENSDFWASLRSSHPFDPARTLLVDDSLPVLKSARDYGVQHLLAVQFPDSSAGEKDVEDFAAIDTFLDIMPR